MTTRLSARIGPQRRTTGSIMVHAIVGLTVLMFLAVTLLSISRAMVNHATRQVRSAQALAIAEAGCARGVVMLEQGAVSSVPYEERSISIGNRKMDLQIVAVDSARSGAYGVQGYEIRGTGYAGHIKRTIALGGSHDSFLSYSRFVQSGGVGYNAGATLTGQVYCGGNLTLSGYPVNFMEDVAVTGRVRNKSRGIFHKALTEGTSPIPLSGSMSVPHYRGLAQQAGLYFSSGTPEIDLGLFDFSGGEPTYNGTGLGTGFNGVVFAERDLAVKGLLEGRSVTLVAGDDIIINDNVRTGNTRTSVGVSEWLKFSARTGQEVVKSVNLNELMDGISNSVKLHVKGRKWYRFNMYLREDSNVIGVATLQRPADAMPGTPRAGATILAGRTMDPDEHTYTADIHFWSKGRNRNPNTGKGPNYVSVEAAAGAPVNVALIAKDYVYISKYTPRVLTIDAALFARDRNWRPTDYRDGRDRDNSHPACYGVWDLDQDGQIETRNEDGYNESNCGSSTWALTINGPIITRNGGSAGAWSYQGQRQGKGTRHYNYDDDIVHYQPPSFPVILSRWAVLYWREV